jgi:hypothetical protein
MWTGKAIKTAEWNERVTNSRRRKLTAAWQKRLKQLQAVMPSELKRPEFEQQRMQAEAQRGALAGDAIGLLRQGRRDKRRQQKELLDQKKYELAEAVRQQYMMPPGAPRAAATGQL